MNRLLRAASWACLITVAVLALLPREAMMRPGWGGSVEHTVAYLGTGLVTALAHAQRHGHARVALALTLYAAVLEALQVFSPGRHAAVSDALASATGVLIGVTLAAALTAVLAATLGALRRRARTGLGTKAAHAVSTGSRSG